MVPTLLITELEIMGGEERAKRGAEWLKPEERDPKRGEGEREA